MIKIRIEGAGGTIAASIVRKALEDAGIRVSHWELYQDSASEKAAVTRAATKKKALVAIYEMPSARK